MDVRGAYRGGENRRHMHVALHFSKKVVQNAHREQRWSYLQALQEGGGCIARCAAYQDFSPQFGAQLVGHPHLAPGQPPHHKGYNALPLQHACVSPLLSNIANIKEKKEKTGPFNINVTRSQKSQWAAQVQTANTSVLLLQA